MVCAGNDRHLGAGLDRHIQISSIFGPQETMMIHLRKQNFAMPCDILVALPRHSKLAKYISSFTIGMDLRLIVPDLKMNGMKSCVI
jgi:hypothetical protein